MNQQVVENPQAVLAFKWPGIVRMRDLDWTRGCPIARCLMVTWSLFLRRCWFCIGLLACRKIRFTCGNS